MNFDEVKPLLTGDCAAVWMMAVFLGIALCAALVGLSIHVRNAVLGARLLKVCGSWRVAVVEVEELRARMAPKIREDVQ